MDYLQWIPNRIAELRTQKGVSARDMSLTLGQSESYINKIENHRICPSMAGFLYICEFLEVTPQEFFTPTAAAPGKTRELAQRLERLTPKQTAHILQLVDDLTENSR